MHGWKTRNVLAMLFAFVLVNVAATCQKHKITDTTVCSVAGVMAAGMDCAHTNSDKTFSMDLDETLAFLEPQVGDPDKGIPDRGGAMCVSGGDYKKRKDDLEILCRMLGNRCTVDMIKSIRAIGGRLDGLQKSGLKKAPRKK